MVDSIVKIFSGLSTAAKAAEAFKTLLRKRRGDQRVLLEEIKHNLGLCWMVVESGTDPMKVVPEMSTKEYDRILRTGFEFNSLKRGRIRSNPKYKGTELSSFVGKQTSYLIENIYDKIKDLKRRYKIDRDNPKIRWSTSIISLQKRMLLLMQHLRG